MTENPQPQAPDTTSAPTALAVPDKPALEGLEATWSERWKADDTYRFDRTQPRENVYAIDTPPPTTSPRACSARASTRAAASGIGST